MKSFYYDLFLMFLTYGILVILSIQLMKVRKRRKSDDDDEGRGPLPQKPIIPDLPDGVVWPNKPSIKEDAVV